MEGVVLQCYGASSSGYKTDATRPLDDLVQNFEMGKGVSYKFYL